VRQLLTHGGKDASEGSITTEVHREKDGRLIGHQLPTTEAVPF